MWRAFWKEINTASDFRADPYGELTNQSAHAFLGMMLAILFSFAGLLWFGEFPHKEGVVIAVTMPYILGELFKQRWRGWDTVADVFFYAIGGYGVLSSLSEVKVGDAVYLEPNPVGFFACLSAFIAVLLIRLHPRVKAKYNRQ